MVTRVGPAAEGVSAGSARQNIDVVAVTGTTRPWGLALLQELEKDRRVKRIVSIDTGKPAGRFRKTGFHELKPRDPALVDLLREEGVQVVAHLDFIEAYLPDDEVFERNVLGTMFLLSAAARAGVRRVLIKSTFEVYGAKRNNPTFMAESTPLRASGEGQYVRDRLEVERHAAGFARGKPDVEVCSLRFAAILGSSCRTPLTEYMAGEAVPTLLGFDPLFQVIHEADVVAALVQGLHSRARGPVNVAAHGTLALSRIIKKAGKTPAPVLTPLTAPVFDFLRRWQLLVSQPLAQEFLKYPCMMDTHRMVEKLGFEPVHTAEETVLAYARREAMKGYT